MLSAAEAVCDTGDGGSLDVLGTLASLVDKSLITQDLLVSGDDPRFSMLETIREYALERLEASGEAPRVRDQHTVCYLHFAETAAARVDDGQPDWIERLEREHDNMRAALEWASRHQQAETALRLAAALASFWLLRGHLSEGRRWLDLALASSGGVPPALRARALHAAGQLAQYQSDFDTAEALGNESLFLYQSLGDKPACVASLQALARVARLRGQLAPSRALYEQSLAVATEIGDRSGAARALLYMAVSSWWQGDGAAARPLLEEALATFRAVGDPRGVADALNNLAWVSMTDGDYTQARVLHEDALAASHELGDQRGIARTLHGIGALAMSRGDYDEAAVLFRKSLAGFLPLGERWFMYMNLVGLATVAHRREQALLAAALLGTADRVWESLAATEASRAAWEFSQTQPTLEAVRHELGEERFAAVWLRGRGMSPERALALQHEDSALDSGIPMLEGFGC
jgi:tetratricopeptide (TPR) repeat protein